MQHDCARICNCVMKLQLCIGVQAMLIPSQGFMHLHSTSPHRQHLLKAVNRLPTSLYVYIKQASAITPTFLHTPAACLSGLHTLNACAWRPEPLLFAWVTLLQHTPRHARITTH